MSPAALFGFLVALALWIVGMEPRSAAFWGLFAFVILLLLSRVPTRRL